MVWWQYWKRLQRFDERETSKPAGFISQKHQIMQTNATHGVRINPENNNLIIEIECENKIEAIDYYERLIQSLINLLNERSDNFATDTDTNYCILRFISSILPNCEQIEKFLFNNSHTK